MAKSKINMLKDMKIQEVSLVTDPACPGADILFTKRNQVVGEARILKFDPEQPRDDHGRWTRWAGRAIGSSKDAVRRLGAHAKGLAETVANNQVAQAAKERLLFAAGRAAAHSVSAVRTTRARGAHPVRGGGVQFDFEHTLADKSKLLTSVQLRPEHLSALDRVVRNKEGDTVLERASTLQRALGVVHTALVRGGLQEKPSFAGQRPGWLSYERIDPTEVEIRDARAERDKMERKRSSGLFPSLFSSSSSFGSSQAPSAAGVSRPVPAPMSTDVNRVSMRSAPGGVPEYIKPGLPPAWVSDADERRPPGYGVKDTEEGWPVPLSDNHNSRTSGGWPYYRSTGEFVIGARPDVQEAIEHVHDWLAKEPGAKAIREASMARGINPTTAGGRAYFSREGWYIPAGDEREQQSYLRRYQQERDRGDEEKERIRRASTSHPPRQLFDQGSGHTRDLLKEADDEIAAFLRHSSVTKIASARAYGSAAGSLRWNEPHVAKNLFH